MDFALRSLAQDFGHGHVLAAHRHRWGQLIFAAGGTMRVRAGDIVWLVPPSRALWAPAGVTHAIEMRSATAMRTVYVPPGRDIGLPAATIAIEVGPLLRELILHIVSRGMLREDLAEEARLADVFVDQLRSAEQLQLQLPMPQDRRVRPLAERLLADPSDERTQKILARACGASARTIQRIFLGETGMRFVEWRQRLRLLHAVSQLNLGASVTRAGAEAGYASTSAFIAAFRQQMGETPARYLRRRP